MLTTALYVFVALIALLIVLAYGWLLFAPTGDDD
jgi:hypothetical protein